MKKVFTLTILLIALTSSFVFADTMPLPSWYDSTLQSTHPYVVYNGSNMWAISSEPFINKTSWGTKVGFKSTATGYYGADFHFGLNSGEQPIQTVSQSNHDIMNITDSTVFFGAPMTPFQLGMVGAQQNLLRNLVLILPIILGGLLLLIGFRKAWEMLMRTFKVI